MSSGWVSSTSFSAIVRPWRRKKERVLAGDPDEAAYQAEEFLKSKPLSAYYDEVAIKGLALAQVDMNRGGLDHDRRMEIKEAVDGIIDDLSDHDDISPTETQNGETVAERPPGSQDVVVSAWRDNAVMCVAGRGSIDEASAAMLAQLLGKHGIGAYVVPCEKVSPATIFRLDVAGSKWRFCATWRRVGSPMRATLFAAFVASCQRQGSSSDFGRWARRRRGTARRWQQPAPMASLPRSGKPSIR